MSYNHELFLIQTLNFSLYLKDLFADKPFNLSLTEANILSENAFFPELKKRTLDKILPPVGNEDSVWYLVDYISVRPERDLKYFQNNSAEDIDSRTECRGIEYRCTY